MSLSKRASRNIRAELGGRRITQRQLAAGAGFASHNYVSTRLRDEKPFTLDDIERIATYLEVSVAEVLGLGWRP